MHDIAPGGASQSRPPAGQSGDVDSNGEIVDELRQRLDAAIGDVAGIDREDILRDLLEQIGRVIDLAERRAQRHRPGVRVVNGEPRYSAAWLDS